MRKAAVKRATKETDVTVAIDLDGEGVASISTGIGFLDHMLDLLARHSRIDITVKAAGDLHVGGGACGRWSPVTRVAILGSGGMLRPNGRDGGHGSDRAYTLIG